MKVCNKCKESKLPIEFGSDKSKPDKLRTSCKICTRASQLERYNQREDVINYRAKPKVALTKEDVAEYKRKWAATNIDRLREARVANYKANTQSIKNRVAEWSAANPSKVRLNKKRWKDNNPEINARSRLKRRGIKSNCSPVWATSEFETFRIRETYHLARLRTKVTGVVWHVDHAIPLVSNIVCGLHCADNLEVIPARANLSKGNYYWKDMP